MSPISGEQLGPLQTLSFFSADIRREVASIVTGAIIHQLPPDE